MIEASHICYCTFIEKYMKLPPYMWGFFSVVVVVLITVPLASPQLPNRLPRIFQEQLTFNCSYNARETPCIPYQGKVKQCASCAIRINQEARRLCLFQSLQYIVWAPGNVVTHVKVAGHLYLVYLMFWWPHDFRKKYQALSLLYCDLIALTKILGQNSNKQKRGSC